MRQSKRTLTPAALAAGLILAVQPAAAQEVAPDSEPSIVVTTGVLGTVVREVAGAEADVTVLMPAGADPHTWQPSARDAERIMDAALLVENGLGLEEGLLDVIDRARDEGVPVFTASDHITVLMTEEHADEHDHAEDDEHADEHDHAEGEDEAGVDVAHACGHFDDDPVAVSTGGSIPDDHTRYIIALEDGAASVTLERADAGDVAIFLGADVPVALSDAVGEALTPEQLMPVGEACEPVTTVAVFDLMAGAYTLDLGPATDVSEVDLVWEEAGHGHAHADEHMHEGDEHADEHDHDHAEDEEHVEGDHDRDENGHSHGPEDPHFWLDPLAMRAVVEAMVPALDEIGVDATVGAEAVITDLTALDAEIEEALSGIEAEQRKLVTGHEALGYFADRYDFEVVGTVIPSDTTSGDASARDVAALIETIEEEGVSVVFTDVGTPQSVARTVAEEAGAEIVELSVAQIPEDGTYRTFMLEFAQTIVDAFAE